MYDLIPTQCPASTDYKWLCILGQKNVSGGRSEVLVDLNNTERPCLIMRMQSPNTGTNSAETWDIDGWAFANKTYGH